VVRTDLTCPARIAEALTLRPSAVIVESVLNGPTCDIPVIEPLLESGVPVILDNSVVSHGLSGAFLTGRSPVLVVESGSKYLCRQASSGVIYGWGESGHAARLVARKVGQQLQGRALHRMRIGEIVHCGHRVAAQAARAEEFATTLRAELPAALVSTAATGAAERDDALAGLVHAGRGGCLLFVSLGESDVDGDELYQSVVAEWAAATGQPVRAGFGWTTTAGRSYGRDALNTSAGRSFIRMSIGLESPERQRELALTFAKVAGHRMGV
jgi:cystathionine beta-lyase/cystathionine gamma-synthase